MRNQFMLADFFVWYYGKALRDISVLWLNGIWFIVHFFSIPLLLRTLFLPWRRMTDTYARGSVEEFLSTFVMNVMTRVFGAMVRSVIIFIGVFFLIVATIILVLVLTLWLILPLGSVVAFLFGINLLVV